MPIHIFDTNALALLGQIEGPQWLALQRAKLTLGTSFFAWLHAWNLKQASEYKDSDDPVSEFMEPSHDGVIYGEGGSHRWRVSSKGELILLGWSSRSARIALAREMGFTVQGGEGSP